MKNQIVSLVLSLVLASSLFTTCLAIDVNGGNGNSEAVVNQESTSFSVTVPSSLPISVDNKGQVTVADNVKIVNNSYGPIKVSNIAIESVSPWVLTDYDKDFSKAKIGLKEYGLVLNGDKTTPDGNLILTDSNWPSINGKSELSLYYNGNLGIQKESVSNENIANVVFTVGWDTSSKYVLAKDSDFKELNYLGGTPRYLKYIGTDDYVEVPHVIKGVAVTSYFHMFANTSVKGVKSTNTNVTSMQGMFDYSTSTSLDVSELNTSSVINMYEMFAGSKANSLDLSSFDTSNVTNMSYMFYRSRSNLNLSSFNTSNVTNMFRMFCNYQVTSLDLSSFDTRRVTNIDEMFFNSEIIVGYARTQDDANKLNISKSKPKDLTFVVK